MSQQSTTVRALLATLVAGGLRHLVMSPGSRSTPLVQAATERPELTLHVVLDERTAGFFALGLARATQTLCGTLCTSGSAAAHVLPAAIEATESGDALVAITADRPVSARGWGAPQAILQPGLLAPYAAHFAEIDALDQDVAEHLVALQHALRRVTSFGGVVHVNVPLALPLALEPGNPAQLPEPTRVAVPTGLPIAPPKPGERLLLVAGPLPFSADLPTFLRKRLPVHQVVLVAEATSGLRDAAAAMRHADAYLRDPDVRAALMPDRIVRLGAWPVSKGMQLLLEDAKRLGIPVDAVQPRRVSDPLRQNRLTLQDEPAIALRDWPIVPDALPNTPWVAQWRAVDAAIRLPAPGWHEAADVAALAESLLPRSTLVLGNSMPVRDWDAFAPLVAPGVRVEVSRGAAGIDGTLATAAGIAVGRQEPVTVYLGDCTFLHDVGTLQILAGHQLRHAGLRICVADNNGGAIFDYLPARTAMPERVHEACFAAPHRLDLAAIAAGFGLNTRLCRTIADWREALLQPVAADQVQVLIAQLDRVTSEAMHRTHWRESAALARAALGGPQ